MLGYFIVGAVLAAILASATPVLAWAMLGGAMAVLLWRVSELSDWLQSVRVDVAALRTVRRFTSNPNELSGETASASGGAEANTAAGPLPEPAWLAPRPEPQVAPRVAAELQMLNPAPPPIPPRSTAPLLRPIEPQLIPIEPVPSLPLETPAPARASFVKRAAVEVPPVFAASEPRAPLANAWVAPLRAELEPEQAPPIELAPWLQALLSFENWPIKLGMLLLLIGLGSAYRYLVENGFLVVSIEIRLLGIAGIALAALAFGWSKRVEKRSFALSVQGGALGALLLTCYAALRLYHLLPAPLAFALMLAVVATGVLLAVLQNAMWLAIFAALGGFAAPILASTGQGSHVQLFSYFLLLNGGVLAIALYKGWRPLNLLGAIATFGIGLSWGFKFYKPEFFDSVEPFLIAFFLIYVAITVAYTLRHGEGVPVLDGILVFGVPLAAFGSQAGLLADDPEQLGISAFVVSLIYAGLAYFLRNRPAAELLQRCFVLLAATFLTIATPLYFQASWTSALWALEGAGVLWLGLRQQRWLPQLLGLGLQAFAWVAYVAGYEAATRAPVLLNGQFSGALLLAVGAFACSLLLERAGSRVRSTLLFVAGLAWWAFCGLHEIDAHAAPGFEFALLIAWLGLTQLLAALLRENLTWSRMAFPAQLILALTPVWVLLGEAQSGDLFANGRGLAFAFYALASLLSMHLLRTPWAGRLGSCHALWLFGVALALSLQGRDLLPPLSGDGLHSALLAIPFVALFAGLHFKFDSLAWPLQREFPLWRESLANLLAWLLGAALLVSCAQRGDATPLSFIPIVNPLELTQLLTFALLYAHMQRQPMETRDALRLPVLALAFALFTTLALRMTLHWFEPSSDSLLSVAVTRNGQAALSIVWSIMGCGAMLLGNARGRRQVWISGAVLMGIVLLKMLIVDRKHLGELAGIVAMLGVGGLLAAVGYFAPAPPAKEV